MAVPFQPPDDTDLPMDDKSGESEEMGLDDQAIWSLRMRNPDVHA